MLSGLVSCFFFLSAVTFLYLLREDKVHPQDSSQHSLCRYGELDMLHSANITYYRSIIMYMESSCADNTPEMSE